MRCCDRCKKEMDINKDSFLNGEKFELCSSCAEFISNHIKKFKLNKGLIGNLFGEK